MEIFLSTLNQMAYLFTLILIGFVLAKLKVVPPGAVAILSKLENALFIPALVMGTFISNFTVDKISSAGVLFFGSFGVLAVTIPLSILAARICSRDAYIRRIYTYGLAFSNFGFMGNAVVSALYPEIFMEYLIFTLALWILIYMWGVSALLIADGNKKTVVDRLKSFVNPMFIGMIIGIILGLTQAPLPAFVTSVIDVAGSCMSPIAMLLTGMTVAGIDLRKTFTNGGVYAVTGIRLILFPMLFFGAFLLLPLPHTFEICALCTLAMPLGLNTIVIPAAYGKDTSAAAGMALVSHLLSCITIPVIFLLAEQFL